MGIVIAVRREPWIVVAADRYELSFAAGSVFHEDTQTKIILHPQQPFGFVTAGIYALPDSRSGRDLDTTTWLERSLAEFSQPAGFRLDNISARLANRFHPLVRAKIRDMPPNEPEEKKRFDVIIGYVRGTTAEMGRLRITDKVETTTLEKYHEAPPSLKEFYSSGQYASPAAIYGDRLTESTSLANYLRRVVQEGIAAEAQLNGGTNKEVGTAVDVAIIGPKNARLVR